MAKFAKLAKVATRAPRTLSLSSLGRFDELVTLDLFMSGLPSPKASFVVHVEIGLRERHSKATD